MAGNSSTSSSTAPFTLRPIRDFNLSNLKETRSVSRRDSLENDNDSRQEQNDNEQQAEEDLRENRSSRSTDGYCLRRLLEAFGPRDDMRFDEAVRRQSERQTEAGQRRGRSLSPPTGSSNNIVPEGSYALRRSQR